MPETDGYTFVKSIRQDKRFSEIPILVLTGKDSSETTTRAIEAGADAFMSKSAVKDTLKAHLLALARLRQTYQIAAKGKQLEAIKALIGTYKHEFVNALTAMDGKLKKFKRSHPNLNDDGSLQGVHEWLDKLQETLQKLSDLRSYEEEKYSHNSVIIKIG